MPPFQETQIFLVYRSDWRVVVSLRKVKRSCLHARWASSEFEKHDTVRDTKGWTRHPCMITWEKMVTKKGTYMWSTWPEISIKGKGWEPSTLSPCPMNNYAYWHTIKCSYWFPRQLGLLAGTKPTGHPWNHKATSTIVIDQLCLLAHGWMASWPITWNGSMAKIKKGNQWEVPCNNQVKQWQVRDLKIGWPMRQQSKL